MQLIKLNATDSTNNYLKKLMLENVLEDFSVVVTNHQTKGRGQMGSEWSSDKGKNLTFSVLKLKTSLLLHQQFMLSILVSLSIVKTLEGYNIPKLAIKWPNDILSDHHKIAGILIENVIKNQQIEFSVIGIGLNVNQETFEGLPKVCSLKHILGLSVSKQELLHKIIENMQHYFRVFSEKGMAFFNDEYESYLFRKDKPSTFMLPDESFFTGIIRGVTPSGKLQVQLEDATKEFSLKELKLMY
ncbi:biotin--[acetyl-CoA-carboxylase] ligase [Flavobacteriaceae bacterium]|jgi:BirA family transcriptional regulator, biotin operon repressor / biotin---[acetyl-CoA-carboxylase] ligase|nr:biotin--[acetyl-CoA-carboxylase] ligase [Flavobacteriaceae bacterium]MDG1394540.1 biotin--[acetyl-CoA-carboxylase] ligase [Flavobacteriaceae bacterium]